MRVRGLRVPLLAIGYDAALLATNLWMHTLSSADRQHVLAGASTNIAHLSKDPWLVLPASAFFTRGGLVACLVGSLICVGLCEYVAGTRRTILIAAAGHVAGTLVSEAVIDVRVHLGQLPETARNALDVGPSYVLVACACAAIAWAGTRAWVRFACMLALVPIFVFTAVRLPEGRIDAMGHVTAAVVGVLVALLARSARLGGRVEALSS